MCGTVAWLQQCRDDEQFDLAAWFPSLAYSWSRVASFYIFLYLGRKRQGLVPVSSFIQ
jgi:hypothetical protein